MSWLNKLPGSVRSAPGLEWALLRRLPRILVVGTLLPLALGAVLMVFGLDAASPAQSRMVDLWLYMLVGVVTLHWAMALTLGIGCVIVTLMKGPAYVADVYELHDSDRPRQNAQP